MEKYRALWIGGEWVEPTGGKKGQVINPATEEVIAEYAVGTAEDVAKASAAAQKAYDEVWGEKTAGERAEYLNALANVVMENIDELCRLESICTGKPIAAVPGEIEWVAETFKYFAAVARNPEGKSSQEYIPGITSIIRREPLGVTAGICPWNFPLLMLAWKVGPALAAGNTSIIKPATLTPLSALYLAEISKDVLPDGVLNVITGGGGEIGEAICKDPNVKLVSMTGSTETGRKIAELCSGTLKRTHLELGGKAPVVIFDDADIDAVVADIAANSFANSGQDCGQPCRLLVQAGKYDEVVKRVVEAAEAIKVGDPTTDVDMGTVISQARCDEIQGIVDRAVEAGGVIRTGGKQLDCKGAFFPPTVITDVDQKSEIVQNEVFGPVITIQKFETEEEALTMANDVIYGLAGSIWSSDAKRCLRMSRKMQFGSIGVNVHFAQTLEMPWGGYKQSGYGKDMSGYAYDDYTQIKHVGMAFE